MPYSHGSTVCQSQYCM